MEVASGFASGYDPTGRSVIFLIGLFKIDPPQSAGGDSAEQFVAQELLTCADPYADKKLHFWDREARGSNAEVDFLIEIEGMPIPVEVKAGERGSLKSMRLFLKEYPKTLLGIRHSTHELSYFDQILSIPLYMVSQAQRLVRDCINT